MSIAERLMEALIEDSVDQACRNGLAVPVADVARDVMRNAGYAPDRSRHAALVHRLSLECARRGLAVELRTPHED